MTTGTPGARADATAIDARRVALSPAKQAMLARLMRGGVAGARPDADAILPRGDDGPAPLSATQQRLWFLHQMEPESAAFNIPTALRLRGRVDAGALDRALTEIVRRHHALRTVFEPRGGEPVQGVRPARPSVLEVSDLSALAPHEREAAARVHAEAEAARPFDLAAGPLFRARLVRLSAAEHLLLVTLHHAVGDAWSLGVLFGELAALYSAFGRGEASPLPELAVQYADFAAWQRRHLAGPVLERELGYWRTTLAGAPALLELPTDRPRPAVLGSRGAAHQLRLPGDLVQRLAALARQEEATPFMALLAAFSVLLSRYARQDDVVVGTSLAGRTREETEPLIGFFVNTLAVRADLSGDPSFRALLGRVREATLGAYAHQELPFERLVEELKVARSLSHSPVFQAMLVLQNASGDGLRLDGLEIEPLGTEVATAQFDLMLYLEEEDGGGLRGMIQYSAELFDAPTIERMAGHLHRLLEAAAERPDTPVARLPLLTPHERAELCRASKGGDTVWLADETLHGLVAEQAARTPGAVAVAFEDARVTYAELEARAERLAAHLRARGVGLETLVGVCLERSVEMVVALLAVLEAGGAYVPLDPGYPAERLAYMLEDSAVPVLLTDTVLAARLPATSAEVVRLDADVAESPSAEAVPPVPVDPDGLAYMIYTSGSTGRPKGALNTHRGAVNRLLWMQQAYGMTADDRVLQKTPFSFDVSVWEFFWPLMTGATLVVARPEGHRDAAYLAELIEREKVTTLHFVPSMLQLFLETADPAKCATLRRVVCSGEALPSDLARRFFERLPRVELHNLYGPTEAAVDVTAWRCIPADAPDTAATVPIGRPVANTSILILDRRGAPVPLGVPGELFIGGVQVGRGYWRRPALTAERFVPDALSHVPGARMYRTGDLARWKCESAKVRECESASDSREAAPAFALSHSRTFALEYLGRTDFQVKLRGFRIELGEIESALAAHPAVREAVAAVREDAPGDPRLVAWIVPAAAEAPPPAALRAWLAERLPEHLVPSAIVALPSLPLLPNGKADRRALPAPGATRRDERDFVPPRTPAEVTLAGFWREVLGIERVGVEDNFFEIGGHSLLLAKVHARVRDAFSREVTMVEMFRHPTIRLLAAHLAASAAVPATAQRGLDRAEERRASRAQPGRRGGR